VAPTLIDRTTHQRNARVVLGEVVVLVTIIGAGMMGRGIGTRMVAGGNEVELLDADVEKARVLASELAGQGGGGATGGNAGRVGGDVVVFALPYRAVVETARHYGEQLAGKVLVDIANPVDFETMDGLVTPPDSSSAEELAQAVPERAAVVKAFNTTFANTLVYGEVEGQRLDVLIAGDDDDATNTVARLVEAGGLRAIDVGPLRRARQLEQLGFLHISLQGPHDWGFRSAVRFLH
jgi:NADPH-dependent F420 reductase